MAETLRLGESSAAVDAGAYIQYIEDVDSAYTFDDITSPSFQNRFLSASRNISVGYTASTYWVKLSVRGVKKGELGESIVPLTDSVRTISPDSLIPSNLWFLDIGYPLLDNVDVYILDPTKDTEHISLGDSKPFRLRAIPVSSWLIPFTIPANEAVTLIVRVKSTSSFQVPIVIRSPENAVDFHKNYQIGYGIYFGIIISFFMYNLIMYLFFLDRSYLYYLAYIGSFAITLASIMGFGNAYLWPDYPWLSRYFIVEGIGFYCLFSLLFAQSFLNTKKYVPILHNAIVVLCFASALLIIVNFFLPFGVAVKLVAVLTVFANVFILISGFISLALGVRVAKFFVLAWTMVLIGGGLFALMSNGIVPVNSFTYYSAQIGSAVEVILLSIALADRMHRLEKEKNELERASKNALERSYQQLSEAMESVKKSNRLKDSFLATISHELRTPMNGIEGAIELAREEKSPQKALELLDVAATSAKKMTALIDSVLEYSEIQAEKTVIQLNNFRIADLVKGLNDRVIADCQDKGLQLSIFVSENVSPLIHADFRALNIVLHHILDNAIKFTSRGGVKFSITLNSDKVNGDKVNSDKSSEISTGPVLQFMISDTGIGISKNVLQEIFTPFHQADNTSAREYGGLGIGLAICKSLALQMQGDLIVISETGVGSRFLLTIPYQPAEVDVVAEKLPEEVGVNTKDNYVNEVENSSDSQLPILVVEDNPVNQKILVSILKKLGCSSLTANNGKEALQVLDQNTVRLIFMDCQMPEMDGFEATQRIRQSENVFHSLPIIAVTANAMSGDKKKCLNAGMNDYVKKPINRAIIMDKIEEWGCKE